MDKKLTELIFILDRSGSMHGLEADTIGGYNSLIESQRKEDSNTVVTTVLFDDRYTILHDSEDINKIELLNDKTYRPGGMTALLDAIGRTINHIDDRHKSENIEKLPCENLFVIITDGHENASKEFRINKVREMIEEKKEKEGWEFLFLGANIDAISTAADFGISENRAVTYEADSKGTRTNFDALANVVCCFAAESKIDDNWKKDIEQYHISSKTS